MAIISIPTSIAGITLPGDLGKLAKGPLAALFGGDGGLTTMKYPSDLASDATKNHYVQFSIKDIVPTELSNGISNSGESIGLTNAAIGVKGIATELSNQAAKNENTSQASDGVFDSIRSSFNNTLNSASRGLLEGGSQALEFAGEILKQGLKISPQVSKTVSVISLYMPDTLSVSYNASYSEMSLEDLGTGLSTLRSIDQVAGKMGSDAKDLFGSALQGNVSGIKNSLKSMVSKASTDPQVTKLLTAAMGATGIPKALDLNMGNIRDVLLKGQGYAINPQLQMLFRGIGFRSFQLAFTFTPNSQDEARTVDQIISTLRKAAAPRVGSGNGTLNDNMFFIPPSLFNIEFKIGATENKYLPKYGDCVLENIEVNYAPNGYASYASGAPVQTQLSLQFKETVIVDRNALNDGKFR
jgi:hypothetical protein